MALHLLASVVAASAGAQVAPSVWPEAGNGEARHVVTVRDGGFVAVGHRTDSTGRNATFLVKLNRGGAELWRRDLAGNGADVAFTLRELGDGGFIIGGWTTPGGDGGTDVLLLRVDTAGRELWRRILPSPASERVTDVAETRDGGFLLAGQVATAHDSLDAVVLRTDSTGALLWRAVLGGPGTDRGFYVASLDDGGALLAGLTTSPPAVNADMLVARVDRAGRTVWRRTLGGSGYQTAHGLLRDADGSHLVIGYGVTGGPTGNDGLAYRIADDGSTNPPMQWGGTLDDRVLAGHFAHGDLFITGYTRSFGSDEWAAYVARIGRDGVTRWLSIFDRAGAQAGNSLGVSGPAVLVVGYEDDGDALRQRDVMTFMTDTTGAGLRRVITNGRITPRAAPPSD